MSREQYVEGRIAFSIRLPSYAEQSVANDISRLLERLAGGGFHVKAMDVNIVTKGSDDSEAGQ